MLVGFKTWSEYKLTISELQEDDVDSILYKCGPSTSPELTKGASDFILYMYRNQNKKVMENQYRVVSAELQQSEDHNLCADSMSSFAKQGDSGTLVFRVKGNTIKPIGKLIGVKKRSMHPYEQCISAFVTPIWAIIPALKAIDNDLTVKHFVEKGKFLFA